MQLDRIKALTDGVLAIVLTILVLSFEVPDHEFSEEGLRGFLEKLRQPLLAYVVSFGLVATYWVQHAAIHHWMRLANRAFVWLNIAYLLPLSLLPFLTELRAEYHAEYRVTALYAGANVASGLLLLAVWRHATRHGMTVTLPEGVDRSMTRRILLGVALNLVGAAVAPINPYFSTVFFLLVPVIYLSHRAVDRQVGHEGAAS